MNTYSVVIPCYNCAQTIHRAIQSIEKQTVQPQQIICIDNNSADNTLVILDDLSKINPQLIVLSEKKQGASVTRNAGIREVKADYIQFLDADDILAENKIKNQLQLIENSKVKSLPLVIEGYVVKKEYRDQGYKVVIENDIWTGLIRGKLGYTVSNLWPTKILQELSGFNESLITSEEYDLLHRILQTNIDIVLSKEFNTIKINDNSQSLTQINQNSNWSRFLNLREQILETLENKKMVNTSHYMAIFDTIRIAYNYCPDMAVAFYQNKIKKHLVPFATEVSSSKYLLLYKAVGFPLADKTIKLLKK
jgi:glycosyltransferase involved in cell wall biosynthesis